MIKLNQGTKIGQVFDLIGDSENDDNIGFPIKANRCHGLISKAEVHSQ